MNGNEVLDREIETTQQVKIDEIGVIHERSRAYSYSKRAFDVVCSVCALIVLFVPMLIIAVAVRLDSKGPAIYKHKRRGQNGKIIYVYKFRSMVTNAEELIKSFTPEQKEEWEKNFKLDHDPRITKVGRFLRKTSLDELPQLLNIIKGDISIVGPRPIIDDELEKYGPYKDKLLSVPPGLTGYWQAYARSECTYEERMRMELYYIDNANFWWDIKIIFATIGPVLRGIGSK